LGKASDWSALARKDSLGVSVGGVNWGDGAVGDGAVVRSKGGGFAIVGSHMYRGPGKYPITMTLQGNLGARLVLRATATVRPFAERDADTLIVHGSAASEVIDLGLKSGVFNLNINGIAKKYDAGGIARVEVSALGGNDTVKIHQGVPAALIDGGLGSDLLSGGDFDDTIADGNGNNTLLGNGGDDFLTGGKGRDSISGGDGSDVLIGAAGDDTLDGGAQSDDLYGGDGNDLLIGGGSSDRLFGQTGDDVLKGGKGADIENGADGFDQAEQDGSDQTLHVEAFINFIAVVP
jgi:Ca2+-binding RTX toxin-like protein